MDVLSCPYRSSLKHASTNERARALMNSFRVDFQRPCFVF